MGHAQVLAGVRGRWPPRGGARPLADQAPHCPGHGQPASFPSALLRPFMVEARASWPPDLTSTGTRGPWVGDTRRHPLTACKTSSFGSGDLSDVHLEDVSVAAA